MSAQNERPTPLTDAQQWIGENCAKGYFPRPVVNAHIARDLERKLAQVTEERDAAITELSQASQAAGLAEGKLLASETHGVLQGWMRRANDAEKERDDALAKLSYVTGQLIEAGLDDGASPIEKMARRAVVMNQQLTESNAKLALCREALEWCLEKTNPSPCRCIPFATPPHVCVAHKTLDKTK